MMLENIPKDCGQLSVNRLCSDLRVSRSGYYAWMERDQMLDPDVHKMKIKNEIEEIAVDFPKYGYRRVKVELDRRGSKANHKVVYGIMKENNLLCRKKRFVPKTTDSEHNFPIYSNLTKDLVVTGINQYWAADITYIRLVQEFVYLAVIIDVFSRKCIGWKLGRDIDAKLALAALDMALSNRKGTNLSSLIHHSDQGVQYASSEYVNRLQENGIRISMSRKGNPYDNPFAETFIKTVKYEEVYLWEYETFEEAHKNIKKFIELVYNKKRVHSSLGYITPEEFEMSEEVLNRRVS